MTRINRGNALIPVRNNPYVLAIDALEVRAARDAIDEFGSRVGSVKFPFVLELSNASDPSLKRRSIDRVGWLTKKLTDCCPHTKKSAEMPFAGKPRIAAHNLLTSLENHRLDYLYLSGHFIEDEIRALVAELLAGLKEKNLRRGMGKFILIAATSELSQETCIKKYGCGFDDRIAEVSEWVVRYGFGGVYCPGAHARAAAKVFDGESRVFRGQDTSLAREYAVITDGIRQEEDPKGDKLTVCTPVEALSNGATHIVLGSTVLGHKDKRDREASFDRIVKSVAAISQKNI